MATLGRREGKTAIAVANILALALAGAACVLALVLWPTDPAPSEPKQRQERTLAWEAEHVATTVPFPTGNGWCDLVSAGARAVNPGRMVWIPGGRFWMGESKEDSFADARPVHEVELSYGFWMDATEVTNAQFRRFVEATGYVTTAEKKPDLDEVLAEQPRGAPPPPKENLVPGSLVFTPPGSAVPLTEHHRWWRWQPGAC
jgi:formylglycine-generating enzyme required for sulfatase activity